MSKKWAKVEEKESSEPSGTKSATQQQQQQQADNRVKHQVALGELSTRSSSDSALTSAPQATATGQLGASTKRQKTTTTTTTTTSQVGVAPASTQTNARKRRAAAATKMAIQAQAQAQVQAQVQAQAQARQAQDEAEALEEEVQQQQLELQATGNSSSSSCSQENRTPGGASERTLEQRQENICAACARPIKERYLLVALEKQWHEDCLKCACCDCRLGEVGSSLFTHADKILCRRDFLRIFGQPGHCAACKKSIPPYELVMRAQENAYHMDCFACQQCQYRFCVGDRFHLEPDDHRIVCVLCHSELVQQQQQQQQQQPQSADHAYPPAPPQQQQPRAAPAIEQPTAAFCEQQQQQANEQQQQQDSVALQAQPQVMKQSQACAM